MLYHLYLTNSNTNWKTWFNILLDIYQTIGTQNTRLMLVYGVHRRGKKTRRAMLFITHCLDIELPQESQRVLWDILTFQKVFSHCSIVHSRINKDVQCILEDMTTLGPRVGYCVLASKLLFEVITVKDKECMGKINLDYVPKFRHFRWPVEITVSALTCLSSWRIDSEDCIIQELGWNATCNFLHMGILFTQDRSARRRAVSGTL